MTAPGTLEPGPEDKDQLWWFGSLLLGWVVLLALAALLLGSRFDLTDWSWQTALLTLVGGLCSVHYGREWLNGTPPPPKRPQVLPTAEVKGPANSTFVFLGSARRRRLRASELSPFWFILYIVFVRFPASIGDFVLILLWRAIYRVRGSTDATAQQELDQLRHEEEQREAEHRREAEQRREAAEGRRERESHF